MSKITLQPVTNDNFRDVYKLSDTLSDYQKKCVAPNVYSIAQAYLNQDQAWPRAIYLDDTPIGFIMLDLKPEEIPNHEETYYLWRFMIASDYQGKGYGKEALDLIVEKCMNDQKNYLYTSCEMQGDMPYQFYLKYGFIDTGVIEHDEEVLKFDIASKK
jgi:diamine N-acetyltransferase